MELPNLAKVATANLVEKIGGSGFQASYINWARTLQLLREHAPGWQPALVLTEAGSVLHPSPVGGFLLIRFENFNGLKTTAVPQAVMDHKNNAIPMERITARDITDTHRRGVCMAAAFTFGLAYELWAKIPLESGFSGDENDQPEQKQPAPGGPTDGVWASISAERVAHIERAADTTHEYLDQDDLQGAIDYKMRAGLDGAEENTAFWTLFNSYERAAMKLAHDGKVEDGVAHLIRNREKQLKRVA
jgi:hypothetical protein